MEQNPQNQPPPQYGQPQYPPSGAPPPYGQPQYPPSGVPPQGYPPSSPYQQPPAAPTAQPMQMAIGPQPHIAVPIAAAVFFITTFFPWYGITESVDATAFTSASSSFSWVSAWSFWEGVLAGIIGIVLLAFAGLRYFKVQLPVLPLSDKLIYLILGGASLLFSLIYLLVVGTNYSGASNGFGFHFSAGPSWGLFLGIASLIAVGVGVYLSGTPGFGDLMAKPMATPAAPQYGMPQTGAPPMYGQPQTGQPPQYGAPPQMPQYGQPQTGQPPYGQPPQQPPAQG
jgi:hypothetical protein